MSAEDVSFHYSDDETTVLSHVSIDIPAGRSVALVGPSGGGKTTICPLLPRFYDVTDGRITIDGHDVRTLTLKSLSEAGLALYSKMSICSPDPSAITLLTVNRMPQKKKLLQLPNVPISMTSSWNCPINMIPLSVNAVPDFPVVRSNIFPLPGSS